MDYNRNYLIKVFGISFLLTFSLIFWTLKNGNVVEVHLKNSTTEYKLTRTPPNMSFISDDKQLPKQAMDKENIDYDARQERARNVCQKYKNLNELRYRVPTGKVWSYGYPEGVHFCSLPKVGCTYWKRIFRFLNNDIPKDLTISKPSDIPRYFVHAGDTPNTHITKLSDHVGTTKLSGMMFMFSRDPYSRLWSAYIDKFILPDFWTNHPNVVKLTRPTASQTELACAKDITFHEFLLSIALNAHAGRYFDPHWEPMYQICGPCQMHYSVIGHLETFSKDVKYILDKKGLGYLVEEEDARTRVKVEMYTLIDYNFKLENIIGQSCFEKLEVAKRLWTAFQYNGYIYKYTQFPQDMNMTAFYNNPISELSKHLNFVVDEQHRQNVSVKTQKSELMYQAYKTIPRSILQKIKDIYKFDFELFGYEPEPREIFT